MGNATESERVEECIAWARSRIRQCEQQLANEGTLPLAGAVSAKVERRALLAVIEILTGEEVSRG